MKRIILPALLLATPLLSACIIIDADKDGTSNFHMVTQFGLPKVYAANVGPDTVTLQMAAGGCANKAGIDVDVDEDDGEYEIGFDYNDDDVCTRAGPGGQSVTWTYDELGVPRGERVRVLNKVGR